MCNCLFKNKLIEYDAKLMGKSYYGEITDILDGGTVLIKFYLGDEYKIIRCVLNKDDLLLIP